MLLQSGVGELNSVFTLPGRKCYRNTYPRNLNTCFRNLFVDYLFCPGLSSTEHAGFLFWRPFVSSEGVRGCHIHDNERSVSLVARTVSPRAVRWLFQLEVDTTRPSGA